VFFDEKDVVARAHELANFVSVAAKKHGFDQNTLVAIGYSNGANIASAMILLGVLKFRGCDFVSANVPLSHPPETTLENLCRPDLRRAVRSNCYATSDQRAGRIVARPKRRS